MTLTTRTFDPAEVLDTPEAMADYLSSAFESGDQSIIADALGVVAKAKGMSQLSQETGLARPALYRALSPGGHPEFGTVLKVMRSLGMSLKPFIV